MGSSLFCGVVGLTGLVLHWGSAFRVESARIAAPEARVQTVTAYEDLAWFYLVLLGISLGSSVWLLVLLDQQVLSRLQPSGSGLEEGSPTGQNQAQARIKSQQIQHLNAALEQQVQQQTAQLRQALNYEATLKRITDKVRDSLEEDQILQTAVQELATSLELLGCDAALYNLELGISTITYEYGAGLPAKLKSTIDLDATQI
ncbi:MAG: hypothetical protein SNJ68_08225, partial [Cyanobacteriota bacterium]